MTRQFDGRTLEECRQAGGICIDLEAELHFEDGDFYDLNHTSPQGPGRSVYIWPTNCANFRNPGRLKIQRRAPTRAAIDAYSSIARYV